MHKATQLYNVSPEELTEEILKGIDKRFSKLQNHLKQTDSVKYLTRREVCELLSITLPTLHEWTKKSILKAYRIGNRVLYKSHEVESALTAINT